MTRRDVWALLQTSVGEKDTDGDTDKARSLSVPDAGHVDVHHSILFSLVCALGISYAFRTCFGVASAIVVGAPGAVPGLG